MKLSLCCRYSQTDQSAHGADRDLPRCALKKMMLSRVVGQHRCIPPGRLKSFSLDYLVEPVRVKMEKEKVNERASPIRRCL